MQLYLDLDGVLIDFDGHYARMVGPLPDRNDPARDVDWSAIRDIDFFEHAPPMPDAFELLEYTKRYNPIVLTGVPTSGYDRAEAGKRKCVAQRFAEYKLPVLTCKSSDKSQFCLPGDTIVDDWAKHRSKWEVKGGVWVLHKSAAASIAELKGMGL